MKRTLCKILLLAVLSLLFAERMSAQAVRVIAAKISPKTSSTYLVSIIPGHFYQLVINPTPSISSSWTPFTVANAISYSIDPPGTSGQVFNNWPKTAFVMILQASQTGAMQSGSLTCSTGIGSLAGTSGVVCNLYPVPAQTLELITNGNAALSGSYEMILVDLTMLGVNQQPYAAPNFSAQGLPAAGGITILGADGSLNAQPVAVDNGALPPGLIVSPIGASLAEAGIGGQSGMRNNSGAYSTAAVVVPMLSKDGTSPAGYRRSVSVFKDVIDAASGNTALWTPTTGKKFRILCVGFDVTADAKAATAGDLTISLQDSTTPIPGFSWSFFIPSTAGAQTVDDTTPMVCFANGFLSSTANNVLNLNLSFALTGGTVHMRVYGDEE